MLRKDHLNNFDPILTQVLNSDLMCPHIVGAESLHTEIVDETIFLQVFNIYSELDNDGVTLSNDFIGNRFRDKSKGDRETVTTQ